MPEGTGQFTTLSLFSVGVVSTLWVTEMFSQPVSPLRTGSCTAGGVLGIGRRAFLATSEGQRAGQCGNPGHDSRVSETGSWLAQGWLLCRAPRHPLACPGGRSGHSLPRGRPWGQRKPGMSSVEWEETWTWGLEASITSFVRNPWQATPSL